MIRTARELYGHETFAVDLANAVYALDVTVIDLCLSVSLGPPWAGGTPPSSCTRKSICGASADVTLLDDLVIAPGAILPGHPQVRNAASTTVATGASWGWY